MGLEALLSSQIIGLSEAIDDEVASLLVAGTGITLTYNDGAGTLTIANTGIGGSTGSTDNRILRSDGTGGATVQGSAVTIDDSGNISGLGTVSCGAITSVTAAVSGLETVLSVGVSDASDTFSVRNNTATNSRFSPDFVGEIVGSHTARALGFVGVVPTAQDTGSNPVVAFDAWRGTYNSGTALVTRPSFVFQSYGSALITIRSNGNLTTIGSLSAGTLINTGVYTVATLPSAAANAGALAQVTDSSVTANGSAVAGGGSSRVVVFSNGTTWDVVVA